MKNLVIKLDEAPRGFVPSEAGGGTLLRFMVDDETVGAKHFSMFVNRLEVNVADGAGVHSHPVEHAFYILQGKGKFIIDGEEYIAEARSAVFVPADAPHMVSNAGDEPLEYVVIYAPQGPEKQLRAKFR